MKKAWVKNLFTFLGLSIIFYITFLTISLLNSKTMECFLTNPEAKGTIPGYKLPLEKKHACNSISDSIAVSAVVSSAVGTYFLSKKRNKKGLLPRK